MFVIGDKLCERIIVVGGKNEGLLLTIPHKITGSNIKHYLFPS